MTLLEDSNYFYGIFKAYLDQTHFQGTVYSFAMPCSVLADTKSLSTSVSKHLFTGITIFRLFVALRLRFPKNVSILNINMMSII